MSTLSIRLPKLLDEQLTTAAKKRQQTKTAVILEALQEYLAKVEEKPVTVAELAKDYIGIVDDDGPPDLSSNKKFMEGYGR
jgi:predicted DNA-binding protein